MALTFHSAPSEPFSEIKPLVVRRGFPFRREALLKKWSMLILALTFFQMKFLTERKVIPIGFDSNGRQNSPKNSSDACFQVQQASSAEQYFKRL